MLWLIGKLSGKPESNKRKKLVLAACECARLSLHILPDGEDRPRIAIETAEKWARGEATMEQVRTASCAAYAAAASYDAANAASYAASYAAAAAYAAFNAAFNAAAVMRTTTLQQCADIVRKHYPKVPRL
jgi:hypothetical protein